MSIQRGEIYFVNLNPVQGKEQAGRRPVLVLSIDAINRLPLVVTVIVGTKGENIQRDYPTNVRTTTVSCGAGGVWHDYVPFYFAPRSPMLYTIHRGNVPGYTQGQRSVLYLVSSVEAIATNIPGFVFTDGHGIMAYSNFYDDLAYLNRIDWQIMKENYWADTPDDGDRKRRRQAEFLVHRFCPWRLIEEIGVFNSTIQVQVRQRLQRFNHQPPVNVYRDWYY